PPRASGSACALELRTTTSNSQPCWRGVAASLPRLVPQVAAATTPVAAIATATIAPRRGDAPESSADNTEATPSRIDGLRPALVIDSPNRARRPAGAPRSLRFDAVELNVDAAANVIASATTSDKLTR